MTDKPPTITLELPVDDDFLDVEIVIKPDHGRGGKGVWIGSRRKLLSYLLLAWGFKAEDMTHEPLV